MASYTCLVKDFDEYPVYVQEEDSECAAIQAVKIVCDGGEGTYSVEVIGPYHNDISIQNMCPEDLASAHVQARYTHTVSKLKVVGEVTMKWKASPDKVKTRNG